MAVTVLVQGLILQPWGSAVRVGWVKADMHCRLIDVATLPSLDVVPVSLQWQAGAGSPPSTAMTPYTLALWSRQYGMVGRRWRAAWF